MISHTSLALSKPQKGFSLVELMVGLVIGLIATLVVMQVMSMFEGRKRTTSGNADAQSSGSIALYTLQSQIQTAGFGLPVFISDVSGSDSTSALKCDPAKTTIFNSAGVSMGLFPVEINPGSNDTIILRRSKPRIATAANPNPTQVLSGANIGISNLTSVPHSMGCEPDDIVLLSNSDTCDMSRITSIVPNGNAFTFTINPAVTLRTQLACLGNWTETTYRINDNNLEERDNNNGIWSIVMSNIVGMKAQYGISDSITKTQNISWKNPSDINISNISSRNTIRAIRIALVARNAQFEKNDVTQSEVSSDGKISTNIGNIDISSLPEWKKYRYQTFEAVIPLRNIIWSSAGY